jgi:hypothetical protein
LNKIFADSSYIIALINEEDQISAIYKKQKAAEALGEPAPVYVDSKDRTRIITSVVPASNLKNKAGGHGS